MENKEIDYSKVKLMGFSEEEQEIIRNKVIEIEYRKLINWYKKNTKENGK